jgi:serine/threonine-protein kinase
MATVIQQVLINGRYEILRELGAGGSGCVYAACDRTTDKNVAIKLFGYHIQWDRAAREKFEIEAKVSGRVESEHIVQISDAGVDPLTQLPFLVMELLAGKNFQDLIEQGGPLKPSLCVDYLSQVAAGLDKAHSRTDREGRLAPIVHRDLKPSNLFLGRHEDGTPLVKILDWGIAKVLSGSITMSGEVRGTPLYMAPEQISAMPVTPATDNWALGLVAFFLLAGRSYWKSGALENANMPSVLKEVCDGPVVPPRQRMKELGLSIECPPAFDHWFMQCVNPNPTLRFQRATDAVHALGQALGCGARDSQPSGNSWLPYSRTLGVAATGKPIGFSRRNDIISNNDTEHSARLQQVIENETAPASQRRATPGRPRPFLLALVSLAAVLGLGLLLQRLKPSSPRATAHFVATQLSQTTPELPAAPLPSARPTPSVTMQASGTSPLPEHSQRVKRASTGLPVRTPPIASAGTPSVDEPLSEPTLAAPKRLEFDRLTGPAPSAMPSAVRTSRDPFASPP